MTNLPNPGLQLMGGVCWHSADGGSLSFHAERCCQLLALLACHDAAVPRQRLAEWFWPEHDGADARRNLRKVLLQAQRLLAELPQAPPLELAGGQLRWRVPTDVGDFLAACDHQQHALAVQRWRPGLLVGLEAGLGDDALAWLDHRGSELESRWRDSARQWLAGLQHAPVELAAAAEQVLARDPLDEAALRMLLRACAQLDEAARAQRALRSYATRLQRELGAAPPADLLALMDAGCGAPTAASAQQPNAALIAPKARGIADDAVRGIVNAAQDASADAAHWPALLQRLTRATHGIGSMLAGCSFDRAHRGLLLTHGLDTALGQYYLDHHQDNPRSRFMAQMRPGRAVDPLAMIDRATLERTAFHQEIQRPQGITHSASMQLPMDTAFACGGVSIEFGGAHAAQHATQAARLLEHLAPCLQRVGATLLQRRRLPPAEMLAAGLDLMPGAVLIVALDGQLLFANAGAEALLAAGDGLRLCAGRLAAADAADASRLEWLLARAAHEFTQRQPVAQRTELLLQRRPGRPGLRVSATPMNGRADTLRLPARAAMLVLAEAPPDPAAPAR